MSNGLLMPKSQFITPPLLCRGITSPFGCSDLRSRVEAKERPHETYPHDFHLQLLRAVIDGDSPLRPGLAQVRATSKPKCSRSMALATICTQPSPGNPPPRLSASAA